MRSDLSIRLLVPALLLACGPTAPEPPSDTAADTVVDTDVSDGDTVDLPDSGATDTAEDPDTTDLGDSDTADTSDGPDAGDTTILSDTLSDTAGDTALSDTGADSGVDATSDAGSDPDTLADTDGGDAGTACAPSPCGDLWCETMPDDPGYQCVPSVVSVRDYGALPDDRVDDREGLQAAIDEAVRRAIPTEVQLPAGEYRVSANGERHLSLRGGRGITLRGVAGDARLVMEEPTAHGIHVDSTEDLTLAALTVDYDPLPFTQGTIVAVDAAAGTFDLALDAGYPSFDAPMFDASAPSGTWGIVATAGVAYELIPFFPSGSPSSWDEPSPNVFRVPGTGPQALIDAHIEVGARYVSLARGGGRYANALSLWRVRGLQVSGVHVYASPGLALMLGQCEDVTVSDYHVGLLPGSTRILSTDADGIHAFGTRGTFEIQGASFAGMADDSINIHARAARIDEVASPRRVHIQLGGTVEVRVGDRIAVFDPSGGQYRGTARVVAVEADTPYSNWVTLDTDVAATRAGTADVADWLFNLDACGAGARIHDNAFGRHRGRAMVLRATGVEVYDNTVENVDGVAVAVLLNAAWGEGPIPGDILIRDNTVTGVPRDVNTTHHAAISTAIVSREGGYAPSRAITNVTIQNNVFEGLKGTTLDLGNAVGVRVLGNWTNNTRQNKVDASASVLVRSTTSATLSGYAVTDQNPETYAGVHIQAGAECSYDALNMSLAAGVPWVRDDR